MSDKESASCVASSSASGPRPSIRPCQETLVAYNLWSNSPSINPLLVTLSNLNVANVIHDNNLEGTDWAKRLICSTTEGPQ